MHSLPPITTATMATEDDPITVQSTVQYKKFHNDDSSEQDKGSDATSISGATTMTNSETSVQEPQQQQNIMSPPVVEVPLDDNRVRNGGEVVLQMNGNAPATGSHQESEEEWNWINLILSVCSIFCCTICGILATVTSILAYIDHRVRDFEASRRKRDASFALALAALISGVIIMILVVVLCVMFA